MVSDGASGAVAGDVPDEPTCRHTTVPVSSHAAMSGSQWPVCNDGQPEQVGRLGERHRLEPARRVAADLLRADLGVEEVRDLQRDHASGRVRRPVLDDPVVPGPHAGQRELGVVGELLEALARESGEERREAHRRVDAVHVHVGDAGADVPRAAAHLVEAGRLEAVLRRPAGRRPR